MQNDPNMPVRKERKKEPTDNWADDQKERGYYYDDAHGYEQFDPECDDETDADEPKESDTDD